MSISKAVAPPTGYARLSPVQARWVLAAVLLVGVYLLSVRAWTLSAMKNEPLPGRADTDLYMAVINRVHQGEGYYRVLSTELPSREYPTRSVFNWRTPLPLWVIGKLPAPALGKMLLTLLALVLACFTFEVLAREDGGLVGRSLLCMSLLVGPLLPCGLGSVFVMPELWAGVLIGLSIAAFGLKWNGWGVALGLAALFCRELALPYCVLAAGLAAMGRRRGELAAWVVGIVLWGVYLMGHWYQVQAVMPLDARAHSHGWIRWGGARFVLGTVNMNAYLLSLPAWATALYFLAAVVGFAGWNSPLGIRAGLAAAAFMGAFMIVGQEFNQYWGLLTNPILCLGVARSPQSLDELWTAARLDWRRAGDEGGS
jgi:hypothetical protein